MPRTSEPHCFTCTLCCSESALGAVPNELPRTSMEHPAWCSLRVGGQVWVQTPDHDATACVILTLLNNIHAVKEGAIGLEHDHVSSRFEGYCAFAILGAAIQHI
eukprot:m.697657 g.697657  ORF g.697657 m.697657 type:complete len:104 (-) comp22897_c0_seq40:1512-1823(-)